MRSLSQSTKFRGQAASSVSGGYLNKEDQAKKIKMNYIAATNKRDWYCELAFRMRNENDGVLFLRWRFTQIGKSPKSRGQAASSVSGS